jgi:hypothetical protein
VELSSAPLACHLSRQSGLFLVESSIPSRFFSCLFLYLLCLFFPRFFSFFFLFWIITHPMSAPPSPRIGIVSLHNLSHRKRDRPPALDILGEDRKAASDGEFGLDRAFHIFEDNNTEEVFLLHFQLDRCFDFTTTLAATTTTGRASFRYGGPIG